MNQPKGYDGPHRRWSWWEYALIAVAALTLLSIGVVVVGIVMSALSHGVTGGNK
jgi:hypothetical protein